MQRKEFAIRSAIVLADADSRVDQEREGQRYQSNAAAGAVAKPDRLTRATCCRALAEIRPPFADEAAAKAHI